MTSVEFLREFVNERLTAAAEEIFRVFKRTVVEYQDEIERQRKMLDIVCKPEIKLHRIELGEALAEHQLYNQEDSSSVDQDDFETPQIKDELEEICVRQDVEQLLLKQDTDTLMLTSAYEETDPTELGSHDSENQDPRGDKHGDSGGVSDSRPEPTKEHEKNINHSNSVYKCKLTNFHRYGHTRKTSFECDTCGKTFKYGSSFRRHLNVHTGEKLYVCRICGKVFNDRSNMIRHIRSHTSEESFSLQHVEKISDFDRCCS